MGLISYFVQIASLQAFRHDVFFSDLSALPFVFTQYSDNKGCGIRILHGKEAESKITDAPILSQSLDIDPGLAANKQIGRGWARARAVANKINDNKYGNTIREKPFEPHAYVRAIIVFSPYKH